MTNLGLLCTVVILNNVPIIIMSMISTLESIQMLNEIITFVSNLPDEVIIIGIALFVYGIVKTSVDILRIGAMLNPAYWILRILR